MKLLVFSDSHREMTHMAQAVRQERPDTLLHLGDHIADAYRLREEFPTLPLCAVRGNCDWYDTEPEEALLRFGDFRLYLTHGHRQGVKTGLLRLRYTALEKGVDVALFGHTHLPYCEKEQGIWLLNPGACGGVRPSYGVIRIEDGSIHCEVKEVYGRAAR